MINFKAAVEYLSIKSLKPYANNAKLHSAKQIKLVANSIVQYGFVVPLLIDKKRSIIAGHARYEAAKLLGMTQVPVIVADHLTEAQTRAFRLADNRVAEVGTSWSWEALQLEVESILALDASFDIEDVGFSARDLELSLDVAASKDEPDEQPVPALSQRAVSRLGDLWTIADHKLICGDATDGSAYSALLARERAAMVFTDPPYNVPINGHVSGKGRTKHREFVTGSGEMSNEEFRQLLTASMMACARFSRPGSLHYICMDYKHLAELLAAGAIAYDEYKNLCVWTKNNAGMGSLYRSQHELIAVFKRGTAPHVNNVELGKNGRNRSNVWPYAGMNSFSRERDEALAMHPTVKPLALVRDAILDASRRDDIILDPFGGSGTTLLAADAARRRARLIELDPLYCDVTIRRAEATLGITAVHAETGLSFAEIATQREHEDA